jgi:hypothetical protein
LKKKEEADAIAADPVKADKEEAKQKQRNPDSGLPKDD